MTTIAYGEAESVHVNLSATPEAPAERRRIRREQIGEYAAQGATHPDADRAYLVEVELPDPRLASGLVLVDTPGVGGIYGEHTRATVSYLPQADAAVFISSTDGPLSQSETDFLARAAEAVRAAENPDAMIFVLAKADRVTDVDAYADGVRSRIAEVTGRSRDEVEVIPTSSHSKVLYVTTGDAESLRLSGFTELEEALWRRLERHRAKVLLGGALVEADAAVRVLLEPLEAEEEALRDGSSKKIEQLERDAEANQARIKELSESAAPWRGKLAEELKRLRDRLAERAERELSRVWNRATGEYLGVESYLRDPDQLSARVNSDLVMAMMAVNEWAGKQAAGTQRDYAQEIKLELPASPLSRLPSASVIDLGRYGRLQRTRRREWQEGPKPPPRQEERVRELPRKPWKQKASGFIGRFLGSGVQRFADRVFDTFSPPQYERYYVTVQDPASGSWVEVEEDVPPQVIEQRRADLRGDLEKARAAQHRQTEQTLDEIIADFAQDITADLDSMLRREEERLQDTLPRLRAAARATAEETALRLTVLAGEKQPLLDLRGETGALVQRVIGLAGGDGGAG